MWFAIIFVAIIGTAIANRHFLGDVKELVQDGFDINNARLALQNAKISVGDAIKERLKIAQKTGEVLMDIKHIADDASTGEYKK